MTDKAKVKHDKGKAPKAPKAKAPKAEKLREPELTSPPAPEAKPATKNTVKLADGQEILVRGPEKVRAGYVQGNVGWQDFLRPARLALNLATYAAKVGASDKVIASLMAEVEKTLKALADNRVKVPSDMTTQHAVLTAGMPEATVGSPDYIIATRKLSGLVKFVADASLNKAVAAELLSAQLALKASK